MHPLALPKDYRARLEKAGLLTIAPPATSSDFIAFKGCHQRRKPVVRKVAPPPKPTDVPRCAMPGCTEPCKHYVFKYSKPRYGKRCEKHAADAAAATRILTQQKMQRVGRVRQ